MKNLLFAFVCLFGLLVNGFAYDFSEVSETGQILYYSIIQGTETVQLVNGNYNTGDPRPTGNLIVPSMVTHDGITYQIVSAWNSFNNCSELHEVVFKEPSSITKLDFECFKGCTGLVSVHLPASLEEIGYNTFSDCTFMKNVNVPENVLIIGSFAFNNCSCMEEILLPDGLVEIKGHAFDKCTSLKSIVIPNNVILIDSYAFRGCNSLTEVLVGNSVEEIGSYSFCDCRQLQTIIFSQHSVLTLINSHAFDNCSALNSIVFPVSLDKISSYAFEKCELLSNLQFNEGLKSIGQGTFQGCKGLEEILLPNTMEVIEGHAFQDCTLLESVTIPDNVASIGDYAFSNCTKLKEIVVGNKVTIIGNSAFSDCSKLEHVVLGCYLTNIGYYTFKGTNLQSMTIKASFPPNLQASTFQGVDRTIPITIPCGSLERYQSKDFWNEFTNYSEDYMFSITVLSEDEELGTVNIIQEPVTCDDMTVKVEALEKNGSVFKGWESNGLFVSNDNPYTFTLEEDLILVARFSGYGIEEPSIESMEFYPNPTNGFVLVEGVGIEKIEVYCITGQLVKESKENVIDLSAQEAGTYILRVITPSGVVTKQIIKK